MVEAACQNVREDSHAAQCQLDSDTTVKHCEAHEIPGGNYDESDVFCGEGQPIEARQQIALEPGKSEMQLAGILHQRCQTLSFLCASSTRVNVELRGQAVENCRASLRNWIFLDELSRPGAPKKALLKGACNSLVLASRFAEAQWLLACSPQLFLISRLRFGKASPLTTFLIFRGLLFSS